MEHIIKTYNLTIRFSKFTSNNTMITYKLEKGAFPI